MSVYKHLGCIYIDILYAYILAGYSKRYSKSTLCPSLPHTQQYTKYVL